MKVSRGRRQAGGGFSGFLTKLDHTRSAQFCNEQWNSRLTRWPAAAGRVGQRLHLSATARLAMQPLNQPIEMIDRERQSGRGTHRLEGGAYGVEMVEPLPQAEVVEVV